MNPSDEKTLQDFLGQLVQARGVTKDPQADALIQRAVAEQPDAAYLLVQRALLVEQALGNAKARIAELERQTTKGSGGFLDANTWGNSAQSNPSTPAPVQGAVQGAAAPARSGGFLGGAGGGMLGTIAATAAGVAAGSFLFHGIGNLLDHNGAGAGAPGRVRRIAVAPWLTRPASAPSTNQARPTIRWPTATMAMSRADSSMAMGRTRACSADQAGTRKLSRSRAP
jgi:hypothetical protein